MVDESPNPSNTSALRSQCQNLGMGSCLREELSVEGLEGEDLEMRLSCRRPVVLAPTTCPQMRPKERDTDPEGGAVRPGAETA